MRDSSVFGSLEEIVFQNVGCLGAHHVVATSVAFLALLSFFAFFTTLGIDCCLAEQLFMHGGEGSGILSHGLLIVIDGALLRADSIHLVAALGGN